MNKTKAREISAQVRFVQRSLRPIAVALKKAGYQDEVELLVDATKNLGNVALSLELVAEGR